MRSLTALLVIFAAVIHGAEVIDRIAVVVGNAIVKASDISRDLRVAAFLNREPLSTTGAVRRKAAERLVDQAIIREQIQRGGYTMPSDEEADAVLQQLKRDRFKGSDSQMRQELSRYHLTAEQLKQHLLWQLAVLRFIDQRFRPGVMVTDEEVREHYDKHTAELRRQFPKASNFEALEPKIRASLEAGRVDQNFDRWLADTRKRSSIEFKKEAFQ
jgi:peptidyl-prolyl cis-trans isomerase SurA